MKKTISLVLIFLSFQTYADFLDVEYSWYRNSILELQKQGLANGYGDGRYGPENNVTRAEILTLLMKATNTVPENSTEKCFPDVATNTWYHPYICTAYKLGLASGFSDGKFKPNDSVTTLEALTFGLRAFGMKEQIGTGDTWYETLRAFSEANNIIPAHSYTLKNIISRGKTADLIIRLQEYKRTNSPVSYKSTGCSASGNLISGENTITINGQERKYNLFIPSGYSNNREYSLIIATHGRTNSKDQVQAYMGLQKGQSDTIVAYPAALRASSGNSFSWSEKDNMTFIDAILRQVSDNYCINRNQVYAVGHSLGGWMAQRIACLRGDFLSGLAVVGSGAFGSTCSGPVPSLFFQNVNDPLSSYASGVSARNTRIKVNECDESSTENVQIGSLTCTKYNKCSSGNEVVWCEGYTGYNGDPHSWPTPNGGRDILEFLK